MDISPLIPAGLQVIQNYTDGKFKVSGVVYGGGVIVFPNRTVLWEQADGKSPENLEEADFSILPGGENNEVDILLLGAGSRSAILPAELKKKLRGRGIVIETMTTDAACRTYNVLLSEGRRVAAALLPYIKAA